MKIILTGKEERSHRVTCENCKGVLDVKAEDLNLEASFKDYKIYSFICPCCGKRDIVRDTDLPFKVKT